MKTVLLVMVLAGFFLGVCAHAMAADPAAKTEKVRGRIVSVDTAAKQIVVEKEDGTQRTLTVSDEILARVHQGERVIVYVPAGGDTASTLKRKKQRNREHNDE
jgi:hypothetical protein